MRALLTGGRAPVTLDLLRHLTRQGHTVFTAESMPFSLSGFSRLKKRHYAIPRPRQESRAFIQALVSIVQKESIEVLIATCEEIFYISRYRSEFPKNCKIWVDDFEKLKRVHSKFEFQKTVQEMGLQTPETTRVENTEEFHRELRRFFEKYPKVVAKPEFSRFGEKTKILKKGDPLFAIDCPWVVQEFIEGTEWCAYGIASEGKLLATCVYDHEFTAGKGAGICFVSIYSAAHCKWIQNFVQKISWTGQIAFDFIQKQNGDLYALECNPRATSGLHLLVTRPEFLEALTSKTPQSLILTPLPHAQAKIGLAMWVYGLAQCRSLQKIKTWLHYQLHSRDVLWDFADPLPFFGQFICFARLSFLALLQGKSALDASTADIEWNGEPIL